MDAGQKVQWHTSFTVEECIRIHADTQEGCPSQPRGPGRSPWKKTPSWASKDQSAKKRGEQDSMIMLHVLYSEHRKIWSLLWKAPLWIHKYLLWFIYLFLINLVSISWFLRTWSFQSVLMNSSFRMCKAKNQTLGFMVGPSSCQRKFSAPKCLGHSYVIGTQGLLFKMIPSIWMVLCSLQRAFSYVLSLNSYNFILLIKESRQRRQLTGLWSHGSSVAELDWEAPSSVPFPQNL